MAEYPYILEPDPVAVVVDVLNNLTPELAAYTGATPTISGNLQGYQHPERWITVSTYGGNTRFPKISKPRVDLEILAETDSVARDLGAICLASIFRAMGTRRSTAVVAYSLTDVKTEMGLNKIPDKLSDSSRYVLSVRLTITPYSYS